MKTIMVQLSDKQWTLEAMHLASAMARSMRGKVVLLRLALANNPGLLGWGVPLPTRQEEGLIQTCAAIADEYGVEFSVQPMQYVSLVGALAQAAQVVKADVLFAHVTPSKIPLWGAYQDWSLRRKLHNCQLYTLQEGQSGLSSESVPTVAVWNRR